MGRVRGAPPSELGELGTKTRIAVQVAKLATPAAPSCTRECHDSPRQLRPTLDSMHSEKAPPADGRDSAFECYVLLFDQQCSFS